MMVETFNANEVFEMAEQIERNGATFYRKAAKGCSDRAVKEMLVKLADMEDAHLKTFAAMRAELSAAERAAVVDQDNEVALYLRAMADGHVFDVVTDGAKLTGNEMLAEVLDMAIGIEKDSVVYYLGLEAVVPSEAGKKKVRVIIKAEMRHIALLAERRAVVQK